jgi:predicted amidohydrolase YtcJ
MQEVFTLLRRQADKTPPGEWLFAYGFDDTLIAEQRYPQRLELDAISTQHPIFIMHVSAHGGVANSRALALAGFTRDTPDPIDGLIGRDPQTGELSGLLFEGPGQTMRNLATRFAPWDALKMVERASQQYLAMGVTTAQNGLLTAEHGKALVPLARYNLLPLRLVVWPDNNYGEEILAGQRHTQDTPRLHWGAIKLVIDGSLQACTGFLTKPYLNCGKPGARGELTGAKAEIQAQILRYHLAGKQLAVHTNGDAAMDVFIEGFRQAQQQHPVKDPRAILVHAQTIRPDQMDQTAALGMTPSFFAAHVYYWGDRHRDIFLGPERAKRISPTATALAKNLRFSLHLDSPIVPMNPWLLAWSAVQRETASGQILGPEERISTLQALRAITIDAAWQNFLENDRGSIEAGKYADLIILSANPLSSPSALRDVQVLQTLVGGTTVYSK